MVKTEVLENYEDDINSPMEFVNIKSDPLEPIVKIEYEDNEEQIVKLEIKENEEDVKGDQHHTQYLGKELNCDYQKMECEDIKMEMDNLNVNEEKTEEVRAKDPGED